MAAGRPPLNANIRVLVVMGVSGAGKSTISAALAARLGWPLAEGDDLHSSANVAKMAAGHPLTDADRAPWLALVARWIDAQLASGQGGVIACSALRRRYRDQLRRPGVLFVYLAGSRELIAARLAARHGHFMPASLLDSQFAELEPPGPDEQAIEVKIGDPVDSIVDRIEAARCSQP